MPRRSSGEEEKYSSRARETRPTGPEDQGVERPIWQEPRPTERESVPDTEPEGIIAPDFKDGADIVQTNLESGVSNRGQDTGMIPLQGPNQNPSPFYQTRMPRTRSTVRWEKATPRAST